MIHSIKKMRFGFSLHGLMSNKEDSVINMVAKYAIGRGYQVLSIDLP